ncbi:hypothetical protein QR680_018174 [Steinernema hermaphroditum]|uniref:Uncharacterized protein n=1 Tax=Steinernema hermaphroditum TaxID=289476 RepID=A0AA39HID5_9BILA|nr:hypothetical protein QR680_018174 [Steinernema hermaphroditum]
MGAFCIVLVLAVVAGGGYAYSQGLLDPYIKKAKDAAEAVSKKQEAPVQGSKSPHHFRTHIILRDSKMRSLLFLSALFLRVLYCHGEVFRHIQCFGKATSNAGETQSCNMNSAEFCVTYPKKSGPAICNAQITFNENGIPSSLKHCKTESCRTVQDWGEDRLFGTHCCCDVIECDFHTDELSAEGEMNITDALNATNVVTMTSGGDPKPLTSSCEADRLHRVDISFVEPENTSAENSSAASSKGINQIRVRLVHKTKNAVVGETKFSWPEDALPQQMLYDSSLGMLEIKSEKNIAKVPVRIPKASIQIGLTKSVKTPQIVSWDGFTQDRKEVKHSSAVAKAAQQVVKKGFTVASWKELSNACKANNANGIEKITKFDLEDQKVLIECLIKAYKANRENGQTVLKSLVRENVFGSQLTRDVVEEFANLKAFDVLCDFLAVPSVIVTESVFTSVIKFCLAHDDASESRTMFAALLQKNMSSSQLTNEVRDKFTVEEVITIVKWCSDLIMSSTDVQGGDNLFSTVIELIDIMMNAYSQQLMWDPSAKQVIADLRDYIKTTITVCEKFAEWNIRSKVTSEFPELDGEPPCDYVIRTAKLAKRVL